MNYNVDRKTEKTARVRRLFLAVLALGCATVTAAQAENVTPPTTPDLIAVPAGNTFFMVGHAFGTQGYVCLPTKADPSIASWTVKGARPEATLFQRIFGQDFQIITHFLSPDTNPNEAAPNPLPFGSPTWQSSFDSSRVWAQVALSNSTIPASPASIPAGSDPSCPNTGAIACLLLQSIGSQQGPTGGRVMTKTTFIQRLNTKGGSAPTDGCSTPADVGNQTLVPYTADYYFFRKGE